MTDPKPVTMEQLERQLDVETGSGYDWLSFPTDLFFDQKDNSVLDWPDRSWVRDTEEMLDRDGQAAGVLAALTLPLRQANLSLLKPDGPKADLITERVRQELFNSKAEGGMDTGIDVVIGQMTQAIALKRSFHEKVWTKREDGFIGLKKLAWRPTASCELRRDRQTGKLLGFKQFADIERKTPTDWMGFLEIPLVRSLVHIHGQQRDPLYGSSDLAVTAWAYGMKQKVFRLWLRFLDRQSLPKTVAYGTSGPEAATNAKALAGLGTSGVVGMVRPGEGSRPFDVLDAAGQGGGQFLECLKYLDGCMSGSVLAGWMDLTDAAASGRGSNALSADQSGLFLAARHADAKEIAATWTNFVIAPMVAINYGLSAPVPKLVFEKISQDQTDRAMTLLQQLGSAPTLQVPPDFVFLLIERVAQYLDLPDDRVAKIVREAGRLARQQQAQQGNPAPTQGSPAGNLTDAVNGALAATAPAPQGGDNGQANPPA